VSDVTNCQRSLTACDTPGIITEPHRRYTAPPLGASLVRQGRPLLLQGGADPLPHVVEMNSTTHTRPLGAPRAPLRLNREGADPLPSRGRSEFDHAHPSPRRTSCAAPLRGRCLRWAGGVLTPHRWFSQSIATPCASGTPHRSHLFVHSVQHCVDGGDLGYVQWQVGVVATTTAQVTTAKTQTA
jgi:hypothetical protein